MRTQTVIDVYVFQSRETVRAVLDRFNRLDRQIGLVVDENGRLVGTVTDGDVRRGFLNNMTLDDPISTCATPDPFVIIADDEIPETAYQYPFIPAVDEEFRPVSILFPKEQDTPVSDCLVMAGGHGTRMGELTRNLPKPLLPLGDKPILEHILLGLEEAGHRRIFLSTHYLADRIREFSAQRRGPAELHLVHENAKLGTAGAIGLLPDTVTTPLLVLNGDVVTQVDFRAMRDFHDRLTYDATIAVARHEIEIPYGVVRHSADGLFTQIDEKPKVSHFVSAGIYMLGASVLSLVPRNTTIDMPELLNTACKQNLRIGVFPIHEYWRDVGRQSDLQNLHEDYDLPSPDKPTA